MVIAYLLALDWLIPIINLYLTMYNIFASLQVPFNVLMIFGRENG